MPDFRGLTVIQALRLAKSRDIPVVVEGTGIAIEQSPLPGASKNGVEARISFAPR